MADVPDASASLRIASGEHSGRGDAPANDQVFGQYKLAVEMADRVSARRALANTFFLTINSALLAVVGLVPQSASAHEATDRFGVVVLALAGLLLSATWWTLLRSYRQLNDAKFHVINSIEKQLPVSPFTSEWEYLKGKRAPRPWQQYFELGQAERVVPIVYAAIYIAVGIRTLVT